MTTKDCTYSVFYSPEDGVYIATIAEMPSLSTFADTPNGALDELIKLIEFCVQEGLLDESFLDAPAEKPCELATKDALPA